jgi:putative peptide zinc metalloprotease protein
MTQLPMHASHSPLSTSVAALRLPERPRLAPGLKLAGQMRESAFVDPPWLLEREGAGYVQVTRLLYHVAEQCTGDQTVEEIAEHVSLAIGRRVSVDNVRYLLANWLVPRGLVVKIDGRLIEPSNVGPRSPLALNLRTRMLSPRVIDPTARLFSHLYWPPVLLAILCVAALAEGWLYLVHGVSGALHDLLYTPAWMLVAIAVLVASAAIHELGHAAALTYGGGKVKEMGIGLYLVYPAFYTDVSDNYRLGRWARVRTDLGGFYFNLLLALGLLGVYARTGQEFLLLVVVLINLEIVHQLFPFVRLDGYWALADLTGLRDFFRYMGAFVTSVLPVRLPGHPKLPPLKVWARVIFAAYIVVAVPLLGLLLFLMVRGFPRILGTALDSLREQSVSFVQAQATGDPFGMGFAVLQMGLLALPTIGLVLTLSALARRALAALWAWSKPTLLRRVTAGAAVGVATMTLLALWAPQLPLANGSGLLYARVSFAPIRPHVRNLVSIVGTARHAGRADGAPPRDESAQTLAIQPADVAAAEVAPLTPDGTGASASSTPSTTTNRPPTRRGPR